MTQPVHPEIQADVEERSWLASWLVIAAVGIVIFLVGLLIGAVSRNSPTARVTVTTTVTAVVSAEAPAGGGAPDAGPGQFGDGLYQVGVDIAAGNYRTAGGKDCYWERLNNLSGGFTAILANGEPKGVTTVRVLATDKAFSVHGGCVWERVS